MNLTRTLEPKLLFFNSCLDCNHKVQKPQLYFSVLTEKEKWFRKQYMAKCHIQHAFIYRHARISVSHHKLRIQIQLSFGGTAENNQKLTSSL